MVAGTENTRLWNKDIASYSKEKFISYVANLPIEDSFKKIIADDEFIEGNPIFYIYYPRLFSSAFNKLEAKDIELLCIAGYLYYRSTLFLDNIIDKNSKKGLFLALLCQEEATKIMASIFDLDSGYWNLWNLRRQEYLKAIQIEKELFETRANISLQKYHELADFKAAFGKSAIDALFVASGEIKEKDFKKLLKSHSYFSVAFQINDDVLDFKEDFKNGQFNLAVKEMGKSISESTSVDELNKLFYIRGHAKKLFTGAIEYLDKAILEVKNIEVPQWIFEINMLKRKFHSSIVEIDNYLKRLNREITLSDKKNSEQNINAGIYSAIDFLRNSQNEDGSWEEYVNQGGISDIWSTAYITSKLSEKNLADAFEPEVLKAISFLKDSKQNIWGYNSTWIGDADTTNFVLLSFFLKGLPFDDSALNEWIKFFKNDQGFSTYKSPNLLKKSLADEKISNVTRWISGHQCVSAVSFYYLTISEKFPLEHSKLNNFFNRHLRNDSVKSFWWTSNIYTLYYLCKSYSLLKKTSVVNKIANKIADIQNEDGSFSDKYGPNFFITALALEILIHNCKKFENHLHKGINFLLKNQYSDGSWENSNSLQIPDPAEKDNDKYFPISTHGTSVRAREFNRLFTTVSILGTLTSYEKAFANTANI
ncbi:prenyltransferase/squalene oxidase repeat-containing protein [Zunongwangia sp. F363]|uniref:Prenyltransferase/squalene oxidase repeat-containing protein n=1 Tax=Autumnicola tepida TaxID=3075595 RepID=A0ABU3C6I4_9FLAO|nr:prenyltransferase/squalene oxidase repeat-containing protein [Zunongwangia sp. F363]MDT0641960.1 prenyltransferase/squalene oxidase repeat-containing protein [Zunongwangia sp. F363]